MPRKPDTPCAGCGNLLWGGGTSLPAGDRRCRPCRSAEAVPAPANATCAHCASAFRSVRRSSGEWTKTCSASCGARLRQRQLGIPPGGDLERARARHRAKAHLRKAVSQLTDITPEYERAMRNKAKNCPLCDVKLIRQPYLPASKELDHIIPLNVGGTHTIGNVRIICRKCNLARPYDGSDYTGPVTLWACA